MSTTTSKRRCLYDILNVSRNANNDELKSAYRQQAKEWHPDRNINNINEATQRFKEINEAYEILSDKHERAWYDAHRDEILRGIDINNNNNNNDNNNDDPYINLMAYFNPFIYTSFDDNDINSYYTIYNNLFLRIIELEKLSKKKTPLFGNSKLSFDKLNEFYSFWEIFESRRSFQFVIKYNLNDATNRKMRKLMHKENRTLINTKRKQWEESIMRLISFIKKRDPRWRNYKIYLEKQKFEQEQKITEYNNEIEQIMKEQQKIEMKQQLINIQNERISIITLNIAIKIISVELIETIAIETTDGSEIIEYLSKSNNAEEKLLLKLFESLHTKNKELEMETEHNNLQLKQKENELNKIKAERDQLKKKLHKRKTPRLKRHMSPTFSRKYGSALSFSFSERIIDNICDNIDDGAISPICSRINENAELK
eukprot:418643_1